MRCEMSENPENHSKQFQEEVLLQLRELERKLDEQHRAQKQLRNDLTQQAKHQQERTDRRLQEIEKTLPQHQQEIQPLNQTMKTASVQQQGAKTFYIITGI